MLGLRFTKFVSISLVGLAISTVMLAMLVSQIGAIPAKLLAIAAVVLWGYAGCHLFVFRTPVLPEDMPIAVRDREESR